MDFYSKVSRPINTWWQIVSDKWTGKAPKGAKRSGKWPKVRDEHIKSNRECVCCGGTKTVRVHHVVPFHVDPSLELDPSNLVTLCEAKKYGINCHFLVGHLGNWQKINPAVAIDAAFWRMKLTGRLTGAARTFAKWLNSIK